MKYSDQIADWLLELGYTHCFSVGGGNIMHLTESFSRKLDCRAVIHEVAAGISSEYFNQTSDKGKAVALVTAGPGITNIMTAIAGAYLESRELLIIGGQVKTTDLAMGQLRQNGIQEIDGVSITKPLCCKSFTLTKTLNKQDFFDAVNNTIKDRPGPVFLEIPLDIQAKETEYSNNYIESKTKLSNHISEQQINEITERINASERPVILLGGGVKRETIIALQSKIDQLNIPIATTWNAADRLSSTQHNHIGRPNTWGQRSSNILLQQADLLIAIGTRLGMQQTGFNWQQFIPVGKIIQIDIDETELNKQHPHLDIGIQAEANDFFIRLLDKGLDNHQEWLNFCQQTRKAIPLIENGINSEDSNFISPHQFVKKLSSITDENDIIIPCSSGSAFTIMMQVFEQKKGQKIVTNKGLASMGYGLSGAIGASIANPDKRVVLVEGDGGFSQNLQEIGTAAINNCNLKIFIFDDSGYASIRMTQQNYFAGKYVGCDINTGLGLPNWLKLFQAWDTPAMCLNSLDLNDEFNESFNRKGFSAFIISINPAQTYFPKISSRVTENGGMESNPLHQMTPDLSSDLKKQVFKYINVD
jgi:acetolactate synthase I/II/III large subunit